MATRFPDDPDTSDPLIGARLRYALTAVERRIGEALNTAGYGDVTVAHFKVLRFPPPENERPMDVAQRAGMTKQAMNYLLAQLEALGYLRRVAAEGAASRRITLTEKGWAVAQIQRATVRLIEQELEQQVGSERFNVFYDVLKALADGKSLPAGDAAEDRGSSTRK
jgi:DNA-binding MarR family transcriptional regulator